MRLKAPLALLILSQAAFAQSAPEQVGAILEQKIQSPGVVVFQLRQYLRGQVPKLPALTDAEAWTAEAKRIRKHLLEDVVTSGLDATRVCPQAINSASLAP
jgi:hypothetical protein